jgi:hypothetical protein
MIIVFKFVEFALDWSFISSYNCLYLKTKKVTLLNKKNPNSLIYKRIGI